MSMRGDLGGLIGLQEAVFPDDFRARIPAADRRVNEPGQDRRLLCLMLVQPEGCVVCAKKKSNDDQQSTATEQYATGQTVAGRQWAGSRIVTRLREEPIHTVKF